MYKISNSLVYIFVTNCQFFQKIIKRSITNNRICPKAENWHALSHEQYFPKHRFSDMCHCGFNAHDVSGEIGELVLT